MSDFDCNVKWIGHFQAYKFVVIAKGTQKKSGKAHSMAISPQDLVWRQNHPTVQILTQKDRTKLAVIVPNCKLSNLAASNSKGLAFIYPALYICLWHPRPILFEFPQFHPPTSASALLQSGGRTGDAMSEPRTALLSETTLTFDIGLYSPIVKLTTDFPAYSDTLGTREKCHCNRVSL